MGLLSGLGNIVQGVMGMVGIGPDSAAALASDAAAQNQATAEVTAAEANIRSSTNLMEQSMANRVTEGAQRADIGGSGVELSTGSPMDAMTSTYIQDQFKDQVAVFNGQVNIAADQAAAIAAGIQGQAAASGATSSAIGTDVGIASTIYKLFG